MRLLLPSRSRAAVLLPQLVLLGALIAPLLPATPAYAAPAAHTPGRAVEGFAPYQPQSTCSPTAKAGTVALRTLIMRAYGGTGDYGIIRNCSLGGRSEHNAGSHSWKAYNGSDPHTSHVPANRATGVSSSFLVVAGRRYLVKAIGRYAHAPGGALADAECSQHTEGSWQRGTAVTQDTGAGSDGARSGGRGSGADSQDLDLQLGGVSTRWQPRGGARCDPTAHTYWTVLEPRSTGRLTMKIVDDVYTDNSGALTVTVSPLGQAYRH